MLSRFKSKIITDTGISMGDEGKGRLIPELVDELEKHTQAQDPVGIIMKVNGGANSGHTAGGLKLNLIPAGVICPRVNYLTIGAGVVADPRKFIWEILPLEKQGYQIWERLRIDERTMLSDVTHRLLDLSWEFYRIHTLKEEIRGSTGRGISPAYSDEALQFQIFYEDLRDKDLFAKKMIQRCQRTLAIMKDVCGVTQSAFNHFLDTLTINETRANRTMISEGIFPEEAFDFSIFKGKGAFSICTDSVINSYWEAGQKLKSTICDIRELTLEVLRKGQYIIGEFGQSFWLDKRHGAPPNVTASHTFSPEIFQSAGIPLQPIHNIGCCKSYDTKVGTHVFLTQIDPKHPLSKKLQKLEFGTSTGRQRMVGWFDAVEKGAALRYGGYDDLVINKLDALTYLKEWEEQELLVCTHYEDDVGNRIYTVPRSENYPRRLKPIYTKLPAWNEDISMVRSYVDLPQRTRNYIRFLFDAIMKVATQGGTFNIEPPNLRYIGVGPNPQQIIKDIPEFSYPPSCSVTSS